MKYTPAYSYEELILSLRVPANSRPLTTAEIEQTLSRNLDDLDASNDIRKAFDTALPLFRRYLDSHPLGELTEAYLHEFQVWVSALPPAQRVGYGDERAGSVIRQALNHVGESAGWLRRPLLPSRTCKRRERLARLSSHTQDCLAWYESNARKVHSETVYMQTEGGTVTKQKLYQLRKKQLSAYTVKNRLDRTVLMLERLGLTCLGKVSADDLQAYIDSNYGSRNSRLVDLQELESVFANLHLSGRLPNNPLAELEYTEPKKGQKSDFIGLEDMEMLQHAALNLERYDVRMTHALVFINLAYDTAARLRELLALNISDIHDEPERDLMTVTLRGETQKGQDKPSRTFLLHFPETRHAIRHWLSQIRPGLATDSDALFVSNRKQRLSPAAASQMAKDACQELGIRTFQGNEMSPHCLRHTFATLNIAPIGLKLSLDEIVDRLRHNKRELARRIYIADNPYVQQLKHQERVQEQEHRRRNSVLTVPKEQLSSWLIEMNLDQKTTKHVLDAYDAHREQAESEQQPKSKRSASAVTVVEMQAMQMLSDYSFTVAALRKYASQSGIGSKLGQDWLYEESAIWHLRNDFITVREALDLLDVTRTTIYNNGDDLGRISIGNVALVRRNAVREYAAKLGGKS